MRWQPHSSRSSPSPYRSTVWQVTNKQASDENQRSRYQALSDRLIDADGVFVDKPELLPYFFDGATPPADDGNLSRAIRALAVQRVDTDEYIYTNILSMKDAPADGRFDRRTVDGPSTVGDDWLAWSEAITGHFRDSPAMCAVVLDPAGSKGYGAGFITALADARVCDGLEGYDW